MFKTKSEDKSDFVYLDVVESKFAESPRSGGASSGYGKDIPISDMVKIQGSDIWRRVYAVCYSNSASYYVKIKNERILLKNW
jgi:hypothetical protein